MFLKFLIFISVAISAAYSVSLVSDDALISIIQENKELLILFGSLSHKT
jgi:hypothetical protein